MRIARFVRFVRGPVLTLADLQPDEWAEADVKNNGWAVYAGPRPPQHPAYTPAGTCDCAEPNGHSTLCSIWKAQFWERRP